MGLVALLSSHLSTHSHLCHHYTLKLQTQIVKTVIKLGLTVSVRSSDTKQVITVITQQAVRIFRSKSLWKYTNSWITLSSFHTKHTRLVANTSLGLSNKNFPFFSYSGFQVLVYLLRSDFEEMLKHRRLSQQPTGMRNSGMWKQSGPSYSCVISPDI